MSFHISKALRKKEINYFSEKLAIEITKNDISVYAYTVKTKTWEIEISTTSIRQCNVNYCIVVSNLSNLNQKIPFISTFSWTLIIEIDCMYVYHSSISATYRQDVYCTAIAYGSRDEWNFAWEQYRTADSMQHQRTLRLYFLSNFRIFICIVFGTKRMKMDFDRETSEIIFYNDRPLYYY